jgi:hypothetical protein
MVLTTPENEPGGSAPHLSGARLIKPSLLPAVEFFQARE